MHMHMRACVRERVIQSVNQSASQKVIANLFKPNGISNSYQLNQSISILRVVVWYIAFLIFIHILIKKNM